MFRFRDHIISLVAVFFALGLGILIGTGMSDDMLLKQQRLLIEQMTQDARTLREERKALEAQLQSMSRDLYLWEKYQEVLYPGLVTGALDGHIISIVCHAADIPEKLLEMFADAEAEICSIITVDRRGLTGDRTGLGAALAALATGTLDNTDHRSLLDRYLLEETITVRERTVKQPRTVLILLGGRDKTDVKLVEEMIRQLDQEKLTVVCLEWSVVSDSVLGDLKALGVSTIDNIDTVFGRFSLLSVLRGSPGNFGIKPAADQFIPPM